MGSCFSSNPDDSETPQVSPEDRRRLQADAAQRRIDQEASRGLGNPSSVKNRQRKASELEKLQRNQSPPNNETGLRWTTN